MKVEGLHLPMYNDVLTSKHYLDTVWNTFEFKALNFHVQLMPQKSICFLIFSNWLANLSSGFREKRNAKRNIATENSLTDYNHETLGNYFTVSDPTLN